MAFNGSEHYAPGTLVEFFQRMGMSFGGDTNASTGFDRTIYMLELPDVRPETLAEGFRVFSDYAGGLLLEPKEIDRERGVILSEKRAHDSVGFRTFLAQFEFLLGGTLFPERIPIGDAKVIEQADREQFKAFYDKWYRPEAMAVVVVGDIDPAAAEQQITSTFSGLKPRGESATEPDRGKVPASSQSRVLYHPEPEAPATTVSLYVMAPYAHETDNAANRLKDLPRTIATSIINRRLAILAKKENAPFAQGRIGVQETYDFFREASIDLTCKAEQWSDALAVADQELRRALQHGFQPAELKEVVANLINDLEQAVKTAPTRHSNSLADEIANSLRDREVFTSPADDLALLRPALEKITPDECLAALRDAWQGTQQGVIVTGNAAIPGNASAAITAAYEKSHAMAVAAPDAQANLAWGYTDFGPEGKVVKREHVADLDLELVTFANGVRLNLKRTPFQAGVIRLNARVGSGTITEPLTQRGLAALAGATFDGGGLGRHSVDDLRRILAGKNVGVQLGAATDAFNFTSATTPGDLLLDLQLMAAKITDPGYRPEALRQVRKGIDQLYLSFEHTANGPMATVVANQLANGDPRFGLPAKEVLLARNLNEVKAWLDPQLERGAIELAMVGDLDVDVAIAAVGKTLGALPIREPKPALEELRKVRFPEKPFAESFTIASEIPKGLVAVFWPTTDDSDVSRNRRLTMLANILSDRLRVKVRQELGGTYSPNAHSFTSDTFPGYGYLTASVDVEPGMAAKITDIVISLADDLAEHGATEDELNRAKQPLLTSIRESVRDNGYWLGAVLSKAQEKPQALDWARSRTKDSESITAAEVSELAKRYLPKSRASHVSVVPAPKS
jgi:zinc protease